MTLLISDLLYPQDPMEVFKSLKRGGNRVLIFAPSDPEKFNPNWSSELNPYRY